MTYWNFLSAVTQLAGPGLAGPGQGLAGLGRKLVGPDRWLGYKIA